MLTYRQLNNGQGDEMRRLDPLFEALRLENAVQGYLRAGDHRKGGQFSASHRRAGRRHGLLLAKRQEGLILVPLCCGLSQMPILKKTHQTGSGSG